MTEVIQSQISAITNSVTRAAAQELFDLAVASGNTLAMDTLGTMLSLPATGVGIAIFYSGMGPNGVKNELNAQNVKSDVLGGNGYLWDDTPLGIFVEQSATQNMENLGFLPPGFASGITGTVYPLR